MHRGSGTPATLPQIEAGHSRIRVNYCDEKTSSRSGGGFATAPHEPANYQSGDQANHCGRYRGLFGDVQHHIIEEIRRGMKTCDKPMAISLDESRTPSALHLKI